PYKYPDQQSIILPLIKERYRWLPYNYTLAYENASQGLPLVRPLNFYTPGSAEGDDITDEYLWGRDLLVAPVLVQGARERKVVFPQGDWLDLSNPSGTVYHGGQSIVYPAPLEVLPLFVRAGSFIPTADYAMENTGGFLTDRYTVSYYPVGGESSYTLYQDDLVSTGSLSQNEFRLITFKGDAAPGAITIAISSTGSYKGAAETIDFSFKVYRVASRPTSVKVDGKEVADWTYDASSEVLTLSVVYTPATTASIAISL
ncbi:MAG: DUF5110 domain-containing protein, partial [Duncaniella sp.]|nr:DUF5110 domain-containing protein [Duncaniella sp.]